MSDGVAIVSGGLDSVTLLYKLVSEGAFPHVVSFDYGQRHKKELEFAEANAENLGLHWSLIDLTTLTDQIATSALTGGAEVPEGHYADDNMAITVVPNRNMTLLSIAAAIAVSHNLNYVAAGMHAGDHAQYPDCRMPFLVAAHDAIMRGNEGFIQPDFELRTPFILRTKNDIAATAWRHHVPLHMTWSCYVGGQNHCGRCATCVERLEAIDSVKIAPPDWDQTKYDDTKYWRNAVSEWKETHAQ
jgi:7-cyano-7-deazaguanine synthase